MTFDLRVRGDALQLTIKEFCQDTGWKPLHLTHTHSALCWAQCSLGMGPAPAVCQLGIERN